MKPNENVYGSSADWQQQYFSQAVAVGSPPANKCPSFNNNNWSQLYYGLASGRIETNKPLNLSISYCGLGTESDSSHVHSVVNDNGSLKLVSADRTITNFFFWEKTGTAGASMTNGAIVLDNVYAWYGNLSGSNVHQHLSPICDINVKNQVLEIHVFAMNSAKTSAESFGLTEYCTSGYINYPNVISVYCKSQNGWNTPRGSNLQHGLDAGQMVFGMGLLEPYKNIDGTDIYCFCIENQLERSVYTPESNMFIVSGSMKYSRDVRIASDNIPVLKSHDPTEWNVEWESGSWIYIYRTIDANNVIDFYNDALRQVACFGLYFTPIPSVAISGSLTDPDMYIGILDSDGVGHGDYLRGLATINAPQNNVDSMYDLGYDPQNADDTDYQNNTQFHAQLPLKSFVKYWVLTESQVNQLANELYQAIISAPSGESIEAYSLKTFLTMNPIDAVISLMRFPCNPLTGLISSPVKLGTYQTSINAYPLLFQTFVYDFTFSRSQNNSLFPVNNKDFRDYEPYTKCELIVPFCGSVEIPCTYIYDYDDLTVHLIVDFLTGVCTAVITCHDIAIATVSGTCAITLPITGVQSATLDQQIHSVAHQKDTINTTNAASLLASGAAAAIGFATGNLVMGALATIGALGTALNYQNKAEQISYELEHMNVPLKQIEAASGAIAQSMDMRCRLRITRPITSKYDSDAYAQTIGYSIISAGSVSDYHGYTIGEINVDNIEATTAEREMIKNAFRFGVYLP